MSTNLFAADGQDFDSCFDTGSGDQNLYIYTDSGVDIGQKYYNAKQGGAYGYAGMYAPSGTDVGQLLLGYSTVVLTSAPDYEGGSTPAYYGYTANGVGSLSKIPYWIDSTQYLRSIVYNPSSNNTVINVNLTPSSPYDLGRMSVNGVNIPYLRTMMYYTQFVVAGNPLGIPLYAAGTGTLPLVFSPAPKGFL